MARFVKRLLADGTLKVYEYPPYARSTAEPRAHRQADHLYVIRSASGVVKIGRSANVRKRLADLQHGTGHTLKLVKVLHGRGHEETAIHAKVRQWRRRGEWFHDTFDSPED